MAKQRHYAIRDNQILEVPEKEIDVEFISPSRLVGTHANAVPLSNNAQSPRIFYAARFLNQAMPLTNREAPLIQSLDPESKEGLSFEQKYGKRMGAKFADEDATVTAVTPDDIELTLANGEKKSVGLYNNFQFNRKTYLQSKPQVKVGDSVKKGQILASTNFTDDEGTMAMGVNARVALVPYKGYSMDDAIVISESFAKKMASEHNYEFDTNKDRDTKFGKVHFSSLFPLKFTRKQLETLDDNGVVKPGTVLHKGDPIILATRPKPFSSNSKHLGKLSRAFRNIRADASEVWEHDYPGYVSDSVDSKKRYKVFATASVPMQVGDKLIAQRVGQKCYSEDTEILTEKRGWVLMKDLTDEDRVATLFYKPGCSNYSDSALRFTPDFMTPIARVSYDYEGPMFGMETEYMSYLVTPNHRVWMRDGYGDGNYRAMDAQELHAWVNDTRECIREVRFLKSRTKDCGPDNIKYNDQHGDTYWTLGEWYASPNDFFIKHMYRGKVYCVQVPGPGVILTRRNGKSMWNGNSIVSKILPDEHMLRSVDGKPFEVLLNPLALPSRVNTSAVYELLLGKLAAMEGKPIRIASYNDPKKNRLQDVMERLQKAGISDTEEVFDPETNRKLERSVTTGMSYVYKLHHVVESKKSARGQGAYDAEGQPLKGGSEAAQAKRLGGLETTALMSRGAYETLKEGSTLRGAQNDSYWSLLRQGYRPPAPGAPFVWDKFQVLLNGAGMHARDIGKGVLRLSPFTDRDLAERRPVEVLNGKMVDPVTLEAVPGGLFSEELVGGDKWGKITLEQPLPNPAFETQIQQLLGITKADLRKVIAGEMTLKEAQDKSRK